MIKEAEKEIKATLAFHNRIALVFDFDETLAPDSFSALLQHCQLDPQKFHEEKVAPLMENGWDKKMARFYSLARLSRQQEALSITADTFAQVGRSLALYPEVQTMFERVQAYAEAIVPDIEVEFYLLTAGMLEIPRATPLADRFRVMWGGELYFNDEDQLTFVKRIVSYPDKIRYLLKLCKGLDIDHPQITADVYQEVDPREWHVPFSQLIYVGDGDSDMPAFAYLKEHGGLAIGVFQSDEVGGWEGYEEMHAGRQVQNLAPSDYREGSELMTSLKLAVESICKLIALRQQGQNE